MKEIFFVRHGQASFGKENYDELSELGVLQSKKLGEYFQKEEIKFDYCITGTMLRHRQTMQNSISNLTGSRTQVLETPLLNEFSENLWRKLAQEISSENQEFASLAQKVLQSKTHRNRLFFKLAEWILTEWKRGRTPVGEESYSEFRKRVLSFPEFLLNINNKGKTGIVFSSGTPISILLSHYTQISPEIELNWLPYLWNTSLSSLHVRGERTFFSSINNVPHLNKNERTLV